MRSANIHRKTNETEITISLNLDGNGKYQIDTGIGFFDHMLTHIAMHGLFDLEVKAEGDIFIDVHHTIEDIALTLGQAFDSALEERKGIVRSACYHMPMDDTLVLMAIDLSGRPYHVFLGEWQAQHIGNIPTSLFVHFLHSFSTTAKCNLHTHILYGKDVHHQAEAIFKCLGRVLDMATQIDSRREGKIPSSKGIII